MTGHCHKLCGRIRNQLKSGINPFELAHALGAPKKITSDIESFINAATLANRRLTNNQLSCLIYHQFGIQVSHSSVASVRKKLGFKFLPPLHTFFLTETQKKNRVEFCQKHLNTNWDKTLFTDESCFWLGDDTRFLWRKRGERSPDVQYKTKKYPLKVMVYGGIAKGYKSPLIVIEQGTINTESYVDDLIDWSGIIPDMNELHGHHSWTLMQDGASVHTAQSTMEYLRLYCNVLEDWPSGSPDLNPIENLWSIMKCRVSEVNPQTKEELIQTIIEVWNSITITEIDKLISSMNRRIGIVAGNGGEPNGY